MFPQQFDRLSRLVHAAATSQSSSVSIGVIGDFSRSAPRLSSAFVTRRRFIDVDGESFDRVLNGMNPRLELTVPSRVRAGETIPVELSFRRMADFDPIAVARRLPFLAEMLRERGEAR